MKDNVIALAKSLKTYALIFAVQICSPPQGTVISSRPMASEDSSLHTPSWCSA
jgi:hypothetical protein